MIIGAWIGYNFIFLNGTRKNIESNSNAINNSLLIFFFTFLACSVSWIVCQEIQLLLHKAFGMKEASKHGWFDGIIGLPILIIFSIVPCLIAAFINGVISFLIFKRQKTNQFKV